MTAHPDLFARLLAPFPREEIKTRPQGKTQLRYITARTVMNRLDTVMGPENWWDEYFPMENSVLCKLSIRLPDGQVLTKADAGGYAGMADSGDDDKSGYSDAFKRAAVKFGVGRHLYRDGIPEFAALSPEPAASEPQRPQSPANRPMNGDGASASSRPVQGDWHSYITDRLDQAKKHWSSEMALANVELELRAHADFQMPNIHEVTNHFVSHGLKSGAIKPEAIAKDGKPNVRDASKAKAALAAIYAKAPKRVRDAVDTYFAEKERLLRVKLGMDDVEDGELVASGREPGCDDDR